MTFPDDFISVFRLVPVSLILASVYLELNFFLGFLKGLIFHVQPQLGNPGDQGGCETEAGGGN